MLIIPKDVNFLCEIGTEEIPAGYIPPALESIKKILSEKLEDSRISFTQIEACATPRRIAVLVSDLSDTQREEEVELKGPSAKAAYDFDGKPTKALQGFLKGNRVSIDDIFTKDLGKGEYVFVMKELESRDTVEIIPDIVEHIVKSLPFPKKMRWSDKALAFPRPISYFLILFNNSIVPFEMDGISSSNKTRGHYIQNNRMIEIGQIRGYEDALRDNNVIINHTERKDIIKRELYAAAGKVGGKLYEDEELLDTVTFLVEVPYIVTCEFDRRFLEIPDIVLIAEMKEHQKYFAVMDNENRLTNYFLVVSNNPPTDNIKTGNVKVITARFNDAGFFYDEDMKIKLADRVESLKNILFHKELGSIYDKIERMHLIADYLSGRLAFSKKMNDKIRRAIRLCKADLNTAMVIEFPSLQGKIGAIYARQNGEDYEVAESIDAHYKPRFQGDILPEEMVSVIVSLAEKIDNIFGSFSVGNIPKGSQDPYALRRQANAVVELLIRNKINLSLRDVLEHISLNYKNGSEHVIKLLDFISIRAKTIFADSGFRYDEIDACLSINSYNYLELYRRAESINRIRENDKFSEMLLSFKRMNNIVSAFRRENSDYELRFDASLFEEKEEKELYDFFESKKESIDRYINSSSYIELFEFLIDGKSIIDNFFDRVLVMDERTDVRDNRLFLLENTLNNFTNLLDFSKISDK